VARGGTVGLALTGGGARAAYQVGFLRCIARHFPEAALPVVTGVSAGAINAAFLARDPGPLTATAEELTALWAGLEPRKVFRVDPWTLARNALRWARRLISGGGPITSRVRGLLDTTPLKLLLREVLPRGVDGRLTGIDENLARGRLQAVALTALNYGTGQTVTWVQGTEFTGWERPYRLGVRARLGVQHVMASAALPLLFPAQKVDGAWYGDGGVRLLTPLAPALHLGADRILAISTRYRRSLEEASRPVVADYPPPAQVLGVLLNAVFLDALDQDELRLRRTNHFLERWQGDPPEGLRHVELMVLRPSQDLGRLAAEYEVGLPKGFRFLTRGLGTRETASPDFLSLLMFDPGYLARLIEIGERDAEGRMGEIEALLG
jgi:NTE family protein